MFRKSLVLLGLLALLLPLGCGTTQPTFYSWLHNKRKIRKVLSDLHEVHKDFDRIVFDLEYYPVELEY